MYVFVFRYMCVCICTYIRVCIYTYVCIYVCNYVCMYACMYICMDVRMYVCVYVFIHSFGHFYSAPSSPPLLRGAPDYSTDTVSEFHAEAHRQLQVKDFPKVPTWRLERESNQRPSG